MESVTNGLDARPPHAEFWTEYDNLAKEWAKITDENPVTHEQVAADLARCDSAFADWLVSCVDRAYGPLDPKGEPPQVPDLGPFQAPGWQLWAARSLTHALMTVGWEAFDDMVARLRPHLPQDPGDMQAQDAWIANAKEIVSNWAERWNLSEAHTPDWPDRLRLDRSCAVMVLPFVFYEARYRLKREVCGEAWTRRDENMKRLGNLFDLGLIGPFADWASVKWETEIMAPIDAHLPSASILARAIKDEAQYSAVMKNQRRHRHALYEAAGLEPTPTQHTPDHFQWYVRFQVLEQPYHKISKDMRKTPKAVQDAVRKLAVQAKMPLRPTRPGRPRNS